MTRKKSLLVWILAFIFTFLTAYYQRVTGPTYPVTVTTEFEGEIQKNKLIRTYGGEGDAEIRISIPLESYSGKLKYKRFNSYDDWTEVEMKRDGDDLIGFIPHQPPAGKVSYQVIINRGEDSFFLTEEPIKIRFKGAVPVYILILHVIIIFMAMLYSNRTGMEVLFKGDKAYRYTVVTVIFMVLGGLVFGPILQKYAFGAFWTGWPLGHDLTDNKTIVAIIVWIIAFFRIKKDRKNVGWVLAAAIITVIVFLIPHSMLGSELDYTTQPN